MIIAVSDLHLGDAASNKRSFCQFIEDFLTPKREEITDLILMGDILDLWRRNNSKVILENMEILNNICTLGFRVTYLVGNHDIIMLDLDERENGLSISGKIAGDSNNLTIKQSHQISSNGQKFRFIHGHQMNYWYALPFYETLCRAMCQIPETQPDSDTVWNLIKHETDRLSLISISRLRNLTQNTRSMILERLAGPLEENTRPIEVSMLDEFNLLQQFTDLGNITHQDVQDRIIYSLKRELSTPVIQAAFKAGIESWDEFVNCVRGGTFEEVASQFLFAWSDILQWIISKNSNGKISLTNQYIRIMKRLAATLISELEYDEFLVHGHGHSPYIDLDNRIADPGCWIGNKASYISIDEDKITCNRWPG